MARPASLYNTSYGVGFCIAVNAEFAWLANRQRAGLLLGSTATGFVALIAERLLADPGPKLHLLHQPYGTEGQPAKVTYDPAKRSEATWIGGFLLLQKPNDDQSPDLIISARADSQQPNTIGEEQITLVDPRTISGGHAQVAHAFQQRVPANLSELNALLEHRPSYR